MIIHEKMLSDTLKYLKNSKNKKYNKISVL